MKVNLLHGTCTIPGRKYSWEVILTRDPNESPDQIVIFASLVYLYFLSRTGGSWTERNYTDSNNLSKRELNSIAVKMNLGDALSQATFEQVESTTRGLVRTIRSTMRDTTSVKTSKRSN